MLKLWKIIKAHTKTDFIAAQYLAILLFLGIGLTINYSINLERGLIDAYMGKPIRVVWYLILYSFAYYAGLIITLFFQKKLRLLKTPRLWFVSFAGLVMLALAMGFPYHNQLANYFFITSAFYLFLGKSMHYIENFLIISLPLLAMAFVARENNSFGLTNKNVDLKPYWILLLLLLPAIAIASFNAGFKAYYPTYPTNTISELLGWPTIIPVAIYELIYSLDFLNVELLFRGFLVTGLSKIIGKEAILPMVCVYCFVHFGKPAGEAVSSIFGGYALGIIAFYTRNIWGGIIIHIGIAWAMELAAYLQKNI